MKHCGCECVVFMMQVNKRLQEQEKDGKDGDPAFPKHQWPSSALCPLCHLPSSKVSMQACCTSSGIPVLHIKCHCHAAYCLQCSIACLPEVAKISCSITISSRVSIVWTYMYSSKTVLPSKPANPVGRLDACLQLAWKMH